MCAMTATEYNISRTSNTSGKRGRAKTKVLKILSRALFKCVNINHGVVVVVVVVVVGTILVVLHGVWAPAAALD